MVFRVSLLVCFILVVSSLGAMADGPAVYEAPGCPSFELADGFQYAGHPELNLSTLCTGNNCGTLLSNPGTKSRYDLFVNALAKEAPKEVCLFIRYELIGRRHKWAATKGNQIKINDRYYGELFNIYLRDKKQGLLAVEEYLAGEGHPAANPGYVGYILQRNVNVEMRMLVLYACNVRMIPKDILKDGKKIEQFLRERFAERVVPM